MRSILALALTIALTSCKMLTGIVVGGGAGSLLGPVGTIGGAVLGGSGGHVLDENSRLKQEIEDCNDERLQEIQSLRTKLDAALREVADHRARLDKIKSAPPANEPLNFDVPLPPGFGEVPWYRQAWGWFELRTWFFIALASFAAFVMRRWISWLFRFVPWDALWTLITNIGPKKRAPRPPSRRLIDEEEIGP